MGRFFSGTRPTPLLMGQCSILINGFGTGLRIFFKNLGQVQVLPHPAPLIELLYDTNNEPTSNADN